MMYIKKFSDDEIIDMIKNFTESYKPTTNEQFMERVEELLTELDEREMNR